MLTPTIDRGLPHPTHRTLTCTPTDFVPHHVHLLLVIRTTEQLRVFDHILVAGAQSDAAHHANETLLVEHALARSHHQLAGRYVIAATTAASVHAPGG